MHAGPMKVTPSDTAAYYDPPRDKWASRGHGNFDPDLIWRDARTPASRLFGDVYFSSDDGLAVARHTFLGGNQLPEAWGQRDCFVVGETGFGAGLNFLATWKAWRETAAPGAVLHYLALEGYPLTREQLLACLAPWPELSTLSAELVDVYPPLHDGFHRVWLDGGRVALTLMIGEAAAVLAEAEARVDAWFLDGFSPARNPAMWSPEVFTEIARLSAPGATLATFTVARMVRHDLAMVGFTLDTRSGFGRKKEMLTGRFEGPSQASRIPPWYRPPPPASRRGVTAILGAGIAGCAVADALSRRGARAVLVDRHAKIAAEASGNPTALIAPRTERGGSDAALFHDRAYRMTLALTKTSGLAWESQGALRIGVAAAGFPGHWPGPWPGAARWLSAEEASDRAGITLDGPALWFPDAVLFDPAALAGHFAGDAERRFTRAAASLDHDGQAWRIHDESGELVIEAASVVVAAAGASAGFAPLSWLPSRAIQGQLSLVPETDATRGLETALIWGGYMTPAVGGTHILGATHEQSGFDPLAWPQPVTMAAHERNHREAPKAIRDLLSAPGEDVWAGRASTRCAMPDHLPAAGPVAIADAFVDRFDRLRHGPRGVFPTEAPYHPGLYVMTGLGGRGVTTAALTAELLVSQMLGEPWPIERRAALAVAPSRFLVRGLRRPALQNAEKASP
jgi:tRNA 5-methylaminomethyl-2-thiouridine biosynthesis bifunctional protein